MNRREALNSVRSPPHAELAACVQHQRDHLAIGSAFKLQLDARVLHQPGGQFVFNDEEGKVRSHLRTRRR
ncbi:hypothetical protein GFK26_20590 [Variovorax paradoxus]|uniref:Uncharacterized protein n=1 Tax=Variovorax paradoxus TaxID=34073 RepID=A0A5Q0M671_VARPD|nr:hypothetical protein [Variovorax paradoxus]QFZ84989.1 hypothetical protein GFK26_20590 [Variovorax paradoxus]